MAETIPAREASMYLDGHSPDGYIAVCAAVGDEHSFLLRRLGPSIECPRCGHTALTGVLLDKYYSRLMPESGTVAAV